MEKENMPGNQTVSVPKSFILDVEISPPARLLLLALMSFSKPSRKELRSLIGCSDTSLSSYLKELVLHGCVKIKRSKTKDGKFGKNEYELLEFPEKEVVGNVKIVNDEQEFTLEESTTTEQDMIKLASSLVVNIESNEALTEIITKIQEVLGENELRRVLNYLISKNKKFLIPNHLVSYLQTVVKNKVKEKRDNKDKSEPPWM